MQCNRLAIYLYFGQHSQQHCSSVVSYHSLQGGPGSSSKTQPWPWINLGKESESWKGVHKNAVGHSVIKEFVNYQWLLKFVRNIKPHNDKKIDLQVWHKHLTAGGYRSTASQVRIHQDDFNLLGKDSHSLTSYSMLLTVDWYNLKNKKFFFFNLKIKWVSKKRIFFLFFRSIPPICKVENVWPCG